MSAAPSEYLLPDGVDAAAAQEAIAEHLRLAVGAVRSVEHTFYDTFDGRLGARRLQLVGSGPSLELLDAATDVERASAELRGRRRRIMASELPAGSLRDQVAPVIEMRALLAVARVCRRRRELRVLDGEEKTVVRLVLEEPSLVGAGGTRVGLEPRLRATALRGYDAALERVHGTLAGTLGFRAAQTPLLDEAVAASGGAPGASRFPALQPDERADVAVTRLLAHLAATVERNLPGTLADVDSEFLHDLRVAVRRTRSLQAQLRQVFPQAPLARFRAEFRWLQQVTGPTRDLDVHLLELDAVPEPLHADLEPLRGLLHDRRRRERARMVRELRSARARSLFAEWPAFLAAPGAPPEAGRPILALAGARISRTYRRMVEAGGRVDDSSPPEALHELRKNGKELRYLLELFASLYPEDAVGPLVKALKALQDSLGRFQDREIQAGVLRSLRDEVAALDGGPAALMAMGAVVHGVESDQAAARSEFAERFAAFAGAPRRRLVRETFA